VRWGTETAKAIDNFPISGEPIPARVMHWLGHVKSAAAAVNAELGLLDPALAARIVSAADEVAEGAHDDQFPVDVFQTGSGTSSNMNANEVVAALAGEGAHPNDHVNLGQSSNDVFPSAVQLAALDACGATLLPALAVLAAALDERAAAFADVVKAGRTHLMDAVPVTLGQEFAGYAAQVRSAAAGIEATLPGLGRIPLGGTAVGNGLNTHPEFAERVRRRLTENFDVDAAGALAAPEDHFAAQAARDPLVATSGAVKVLAVALTKICNDLRWMSSGPRAGLGEIVLPELQKGSSIMPGKVNPVIPEAVLQVCAQVIGNDTTVTVAGMQGNFELNVMIPVMARNVIQSIELAAAAGSLLAERCVAGIEANRERCLDLAELTLATATALNPHIGYDEATRIVREAAASGRPLRDVAREHGVGDDVLDAALDLHAIARGNAAAPDGSP
jgi:fumarate hydratase class II